MRRKRKSLTPEPPLAPVPSEILDQFVGQGPISPEELDAAVRRFKKAIIERALGGELTHHLGYPPGGEKPDDTTNHRNGTGSKAQRRRPAMDYAAIDLHKRESQVRVVTATGEVVDRRIQTTRDRLTATFGARPRIRILLEASTESEWVAQHLETLGHEVVVADPNYLPMYGHRSRRVKTDKRDVAALTEACQRGIYRVVHRRSARQQNVQLQLNVRQELVQARTRAISLARAITRGAGLRIRSGRTETFLTRLDALDPPAPMHATLLPLRSVIEVLDDELAGADDRFAAMVANDPVVTRLTTLPSIGPITATAYVAALDDVSRFGRAGQVTLVTWASCHANTARASSNAAGAFFAVPIRTCSRCWCKRRGACRVPLLQTPLLYERGHRRSLGGVARRSLWWRWRGVSPAFCLRCGETKPSISPIEFETSSRQQRPVVRITALRLPTKV